VAAAKAVRAADEEYPSQMMPPAAHCQRAVFASSKGGISMPRKQLPTVLLVIIDVIVTGIALCVFALFHHVLPKAMQGENIQIIRPGAIVAAAETQTSLSEEETSVSGQKEDTTIDQTVEASQQETVGSFLTKFAGHFSDTVISTENSYSSPNTSITVSKKVLGSGNSTITYYIADVYIADISLFRTGFAGNTYGKGLRDSLVDMDVFYDALVSVAGDYYGNHDDGVVIRNGVVYRSEKTQEDICVLYYDGTMETFSPGEFDIDRAVANGAWQAWTFGPMLLKGNGEQMTSFNTTSYLTKNHPRTAIGYYEPGHYCFVVIDGRDTGYSSGMTLTQMSGLFASLGCRAAYNLDGGKSAVMVYSDAVVNQPDGGGRELSDCVYIAEAIQ
jgi:exopolysaccharide biosynthesis protein